MPKKEDQWVLTLAFLYASIDTVSKEMRGRDFERPELHSLVLQSILSHQ